MQLDLVFNEEENLLPGVGFKSHVILNNHRVGVLMLTKVGVTWKLYCKRFLKIAVGEESSIEEAMKNIRKFLTVNFKDFKNHD